MQNVTKQPQTEDNEAGSPPDARRAGNAKTTSRLARNVRGWALKFPPVPNIPSAPQPSLSEMLRSTGGKLELAAANGTPNREFFRDVIRQGYLSKLPPAGNRTQAWRKRYFKLVIALNRSIGGGPVYLEYYADHNKKHPKVRGGKEEREGMGTTHSMGTTHNLLHLPPGRD